MRLIYLSPLPWHSFFQRPHELVRYFHSRTGGEVLWIDPYPTRLPVLADFIRRRPKAAGMDGNVPDWLTLVTPKALPIEPVPLSGSINRLFWGEVMEKANRFTVGSTILGIGKPSELALQLLSRKVYATSFYDAMDDFPAFYTGWSSIAMANREGRTVREVSTVLVSSSALQNRLKQLARDVRLVLNACASSRLPALPDKQSLKKMEAPVIGYVGTVAHWFDWDLVVALAKAHPKAKFRLIGPLYGRLPTSLPINIVLEPPLPHAEALNEMAHFDIGLIPFKQTPLTHSVDPIKYYEYRAMGLPVISSAFGEMALRTESDGVFLIDRNSDMTNVIKQALASTTTHAEIAQFRIDNSWESRFDGTNVFTS
ncbi:MAG: glycosyltransferase family 1 protein [Noviherbaspirillum sp.]|nr:glycosyltransferase family 1 protein [Noviherbaspirillum sp.]